ncbi:MAG: hypothetical protein N3A69_12245, partial [Leptospiraceae bacterium]|nr:hypothetical protein [Leptospiraceae bacterium]
MKNQPRIVFGEPPLTSATSAFFSKTSSDNKKKFEFRDYRYYLMPNSTQTKQMEKIAENYWKIYNFFCKKRNDAILNRKHVSTLQENLQTVDEIYHQNNVMFDIPKVLAKAAVIELEKRSWSTPNRPLKEVSLEKSYEFGFSYPYKEGQQYLFPEQKRIFIPEIGLIKAKIHREINGTISYFRVFRELNKWYISAMVKVPINDSFIGDEKPVEVVLTGNNVLFNGQTHTIPREYQESKKRIYELKDSLSKLKEKNSKEGERLKESLKKKMVKAKR